LHLFERNSIYFETKSGNLVSAAIQTTGFKIAISLKSRVGQILCTTIIFSIGFQAFLNMGVVLGVLPTKGLNLPFISYGGSSIVANLVALGLFFACIRIKNQDNKMIKNVNESEAVSTFNKAFGR
jgi:cell division protein FtsW (lipid II flippase)